MVNKNENFARILDKISFVFMGLVFLAYSTLNWIPKIHIRLPGMDFPIFLGEIILGVLIILFIIRYFLDPFELTKFHYLVFVFYLFVVVKTILGYHEWGVLAFRNAALFYYSLFAILAFYAFDKNYFKTQKSRVIALGLCLIFLASRAFPNLEFVGIDYYHTFLAITIILALSIKNRVVRIGGVILAIGIFLKFMVLSSRGVGVSFVISVVFLVITYIFCFIRIPKKFKLIALIGFGLIFLLGIAKYADRNALKSFSYFGEYGETLKNIYDITEANRDIKLPDLPVKLYDQKIVSKEDRFGREAELTMEGIKTIQTKIREQKTFVDQIKEDVSIKTSEGQDQAYFKIKSLKYIYEQLSVLAKRIRSEIEYSDMIDINKQNQLLKLEAEIIRLKLEIEGLQKLIENIKVAFRSLGSSKANVIWRLMVWGDMLDELFQGRRLVGVDFGFPFRARTVEILNIVMEQDWSVGREMGWIEPHNSFLHILYRSGIIGLMMLLIGLWFCIQMCVDFIKYRNVNGILLLSAILFWVVLSNFSVVLELPYFAIPFWIFFGVVIKYYKQLR